MSTAMPPNTPIRHADNVIRPTGPYAPPVVHGGFCLAVALASIALVFDRVWQAPVIFFAVIALTGVALALVAGAARKRTDEDPPTSS